MFQLSGVHCSPSEAAPGALPWDSDFLQSILGGAEELPDEW